VKELPPCEQWLNSEVSRGVAFALRTNPDEGFQKLSLDCFVASLPRNDGE
jgi:hypothetical protein